MDTEDTQTAKPPHANAVVQSLAIALGAGVLVLLVAFAPSLWRMVAAPEPQASASGAPWHIESTPGGGSRVFDLDLPGTTLAQVAARWGDAAQVAVMVRSGEPDALEAYVERHVAAGIEGRLLLSFIAAEADLARWRTATTGQRLEGGTVRHDLDGAAVSSAGPAPLAAVTFVAGTSLRAEMVQARFGPPALRRDAGGGIEQWLYPDLGLVVSVDPDGKDLLQYVAPAEFERRLGAPPSAPAQGLRTAPG